MIASMQKLHTLIDHIELFDVFENESLGLDKKAVAFKITLQAADKTLTDEDMHQVQQLIFDHLVKEYQGTIRGL
jgi:phenylalanyl-tRNA synthetase beta chain